MSDHKQQMRSYVFDIVRASLTTMTLDQAFEAKEEISSSVKTHLAEVMSEYGNYLFIPEFLKCFIIH